MLVRDIFFAQVEYFFHDAPKSMTNDVYLTPIEENHH